LQFAREQLQTNNTNIEAANSRIIDVDVAKESTAFARYNVLVQSGSAMLAQANGLSNIALNLLS
jgi:flagellin